MRFVRIVLWLAVFGGLLYFGWTFPAQNAQPVTIHYLFGETPEVALWIVVLGALATGMLLGALLFVYPLAKQGLVARRYRKQVRGLESEIHQLRALPLTTDDAPAEAGAVAAVAEAAAGKPAAGS